MIACERLLRSGVEPRGMRMSNALSAGSNRAAAQVVTDHAVFARLLQSADRRRAQAWRPVRCGPLFVLFTGHISNAATAASALGARVPASADGDALAALYGAALRTWGSRCDRELIGEYAAIVVDTDGGSLRLARSPLRAPPLHYWSDADRVVASTQVRAIFAAGVERVLDEDKIADMAYYNFRGEERGWYRGLKRVPLGSVVEFGVGREQLTRYYDIAALPRLPRASRRELLEQTDILLNEAVQASLDGSTRPALMLSGGLDSSLLATKLLDALPESTRLDTYSFVPQMDKVRKKWPNRVADERPRIEALCTMHPRLRPHLFDNAGNGFETRLEEMFFAGGGATPNMVNLSSYHSLWQAARSDGCDRVILGEFGNITASADGDWAYSEYLLKLRWIELARALRHAPADSRSIMRRFLTLAVQPLLPRRVWEWQRKLRHTSSLFDVLTPLSADYVASSGAAARAQALGEPDMRHPVRDRLAMMKQVHDYAWGEFSDVYAAFGDIYGIEQRDPFAYRPFFEFCAGLPSDMFLHDGQSRWLARTLLNGKIPDSTRLDPRTGMHNPDWHAKLGPRRADLLREVKALRQVPRISRMFDLDQMEAALIDWPQDDDISDNERTIRSMVLPRVIMLSRFINYVEGRNLALPEA